MTTKQRRVLATAVSGVYFGSLAVLCYVVDGPMWLTAIFLIMIVFAVGGMVAYATDVKRQS